jgi:hypothetical protein
MEKLSEKCSRAGSFGCDVSSDLLHALLCLVEWVDDHAVKPNEIPEVIGARAAIAKAAPSQA